jgi:hypothetical protein
MWNKFQTVHKEYGKYEVDLMKKLAELNQK